MDKRHAKNMISNAIGTGVAEILTLPICSIKTNYQVGNDTFRQVVTKIYRGAGVRGFYSASAPAFFAQVTNASFKYTGYNFLKETTGLPLPVCGLMAGLTVSIFTHPLDFVRISWQRQVSVSEEIRQNGLRVIYRGYTKNIVKVLVGATTYLPIYDKLHQFGLNTFQSALGSAVISTTIMQPIDFAKTVHTAGFNWRRCSLREYFRGYHINMMRIIPHFMIMMGTTEYLKSRF